MARRLPGHEAPAVRHVEKHDVDQRRRDTGRVAVRSVTYDLLRSLRLTTVFGNPGSTEETALAAEGPTVIVVRTQPQKAML
jgi:hypothetical protein